MTPFYGRGNRGTGQLSSLSLVTQLSGGKASNPPQQPAWSSLPYRTLLTLVGL